MQNNTLAEINLFHCHIYLVSSPRVQDNANYIELFTRLKTIIYDKYMSSKDKKYLQVGTT